MKNRKIEIPETLAKEIVRRLGVGARCIDELSLRAQYAHKYYYNQSRMMKALKGRIERKITKDYEEVAEYKKK